jgi:hypothetical protein
LPWQFWQSPQALTHAEPSHIWQPLHLLVQALFWHVSQPVQALTHVPPLHVWQPLQPPVQVLFWHVWQSEHSG